jgi:transposase
VTIVMGLDQHRGQITAEWIDTATGEVSRARVAPAHREPVRRFLHRFVDADLDVALEATTGWRFVVEEIRAVGGRAHLAEPAETAARRGSKKRAKSDRADARHLRELLMLARLPESWIPPDHLLDLRARVRLRHTLSEQRGEWQQRIQAVLYHHGLPQRRDLLTRENRAWVERAALPQTAREQVTVALSMIDSLDVQIAPLDRALRAYARRQPGCRALMAHYGIGELTAITILAGSATADALVPRARRCATRGWTSPCISQISVAPPAISPARGRPPCAGRCSRPPRSRADRQAPTATTTPTPPSASAQTAPVWRLLASF